MNTIHRPLLFLLVACALAASVRADGFYVRGQTMFNHPQDVATSSATSFRTSLDSNVGYGLALGYQFPVLRLEAELQHFKQEAAQGSNAFGPTTGSGDFRQSTGFANAFVDLPVLPALSVYLGGGLGFARVNFRNFSAQQAGVGVVQYSGRDRAFAHQVAAGLQFSLAGRATLHAGYRIVKQGDVEVSEAFTAARQTVRIGANRLFELGLTIGF